MAERGPRIAAAEGNGEMAVAAGAIDYTLAAARDVPRLALRIAELAKSIGTSQRLLWELTKRGVIPHVRLGEKVIVYPVVELEHWLGEQARKAVR